ncbi:hypothetical protein ACFPOB_29655, partial [Bosea eneae]
MEYAVALARHSDIGYDSKDIRRAGRGERHYAQHPAHGHYHYFGRFLTRAAFSGFPRSGLRDSWVAGFWRAGH